MTTDRTYELITIVKTISGDGVSFSPFVIYKGIGHYIDWYHHLDSITYQAWKFYYIKSVWNNCELTI